MSQAKSAIVVRDLRKDFQRFRSRRGLGGAIRDLFRRESETIRAVDGISFQIEPGERVGYLGPNGAGKSTTIKMLTGILTPTAGHLESLGMTPYRDRVEYVRQIGVVFGQRTQLWWDLATIESFQLLGRMFRVGSREFEERLAQLREILELDEFLATPVRKLSLGQRMRADLAASLLHRPQLLFLDEPTIGLDLMAKDAIRTFLRQINDEFGTTILLTTHDLRDIEALSERVLVIDHGHLVFDGPLELLREQSADEGIAVLDFVEDPGLAALSKMHPAVRWSKCSPSRYEARFVKRDLPVAAFLSSCVELYSVADVALPEPSIEEVIRRIYQQRGQQWLAGTPA